MIASRRRALLAAGLLFATAVAAAIVGLHGRARRREDLRHAAGADAASDADTRGRTPHAPADAEAYVPPKLRLVSAVRIDQNGETLILLRDPFGYAPEPMVLTGPGYWAANRFDGRRTLGAIATEMQRLSGVQIGTRDLGHLADSLEQALLLESPRFLAFRDAVDVGWKNARVRPPANAGDAYPEEAAPLRARLDQYFGRPLVPGARRGPLRAIVSPHIDPRHGTAAYVAAYRELAEVADDADLVVIIGTAHAPLDGYVALTKKDYGTPIGVVPTDGAAVDTLAAAIGPGAFRNEWAHRTEHADEFQAVFLAYAYGARRPNRPIRVVPILVGSFDEFIEGARDPLGVPEVHALVDGLHAIEARERAAGHRVVYVAGVDLTHRGTRFGDAPFVDAGVETAKRLDAPFLRAILRGDPEAALADVRRDRGERRYCGFAPLYVLAAVLGHGEGRILAQGADLSNGSLVTFAAAAIR